MGEMALLKIFIMSWLSLATAMFLLCMAFPRVRRIIGQLSFWRLTLFYLLAPYLLFRELTETKINSRK
jgi:hypothetical protein